VKLLKKVDIGGVTFMLGCSEKDRQASDHP